MLYLSSLLVCICHEHSYFDPTANINFARDDAAILLIITIYYEHIDQTMDYCLYSKTTQKYS
jgi:hypothetical protein